MNCLFETIEGSETKRGSRCYCVLCGRMTAPTHLPPSRIVAQCGASVDKLYCSYRTNDPVENVEAKKATCGRGIVKIYKCHKFGELITLNKHSGDEVAAINKLSEDQYAGRHCSQCRDRSSRMDVLHISLKGWANFGERFSVVLNQNGLSSTFANTSKSGRLQDLLERYLPKIVFCHAYTTPIKDLKICLERFPDTKFVAVCHSSQNHLLNTELYPITQANLLELSREYENLWYASPDRQNILGDIWPRYIYFPNPFNPDDIVTELPDYVPSVLVSSRLDVVKGLPTSLQAASLLQKNFGLKVLLVTKGNKTSRKQLEALCRSYQVEPTLTKWSNWTGFKKLLNEEVGITLQLSLSESWNYLSQESLSQGRPCVGSTAIKHLDYYSKVDPNDPYKAYDACSQILSSYQEFQVKGLELCRRITGKQNKAYLDTIRRLL